MKQTDEELRKYEAALTAQREALAAYKKASVTDDPSLDECRTRWLAACDAVKALGLQVFKASSDR